jgi:hypothetical protein
VDGFEAFLEWIKTMPYCSQMMKAYSQEKSILICLGLGLLLRDLYTIQFDLSEDGEDDVVDKAALHLKQSVLSFAHLDPVLVTCGRMEADLKECIEHVNVEQEDEGSEPVPPPKKPHTASKAPPSKKKKAKHNVPARLVIT